MPQLEHFRPTEEKPAEHLLTPDEVADILGVDTSWVQNHCTRVEPLIPHYMLGVGKHGKRRFRREHIEKFLEENFVQPKIRKKAA